MDKYIPLSVPNFEGNEKKYVNDALEQGWVSTGGAYINQLEKSLAEFLHTDNVAACQSGTSALHLSLVEAGVGPNDVVLVPPLTFIAAVIPVKGQWARRGVVGGGVGVVGVGGGFGGGGLGLVFLGVGGGVVVVLGVVVGFFWL